MRGLRSGVTTLVVVVTMIMAGCQSGRQEEQHGREKVTICQFAQVFVYLPLYIAQEKGFFEDEGIDVTLINGGGDDKTFAAVASGQAQFGVADPTFATIARERGQAGVVLASVVNGATFWGVTFRQDIPRIESAEQLRGLRIATYQAPSTNYTLMARTLQEKGIKDATIVQGAFGSLLAMLHAGAADVAMELEPTVSTAVSAGAQVVFSYPEMYGPFLLTGLYTTETFRDAHPETCQKVVNALERAVRLAHDDPASAVEVARKVFPELSPTIAQEAVKRMLGAKTIPEHVTIDPQAWSNAIRVRIEVGDVKSAQEAERTIDPTFAQQAARGVR